MTDSTAAPLLTVRNLAISAFGLAITTGTDLEIGRGETVAIVGESGSGKSLTAKAIARLLPQGVTATGSILYDGIDLMNLPERAMRAVRGRRLSMMLQDPFTMLNPLMKAGLHVAEEIEAVRVVLVLAMLDGRRGHEQSAAAKGIDLFVKHGHLPKSVRKQ